MKKYFLILKTAFISTLEYRVDILSGLLPSLLGIFITFFIWDKLAKDYSNIGNYNQYSILLYYLLASLTGGFFNARTSGRIAEMIRSGDLGNLLVMPINKIIYIFLTEFGKRMVVSVLIYLIAIPFIFAIPQLRENITFNNWPLYLFYMLLINLFNFSLYWVIGTMAFFWVDIGGIRNVIYNIQKILKGSWFPLDLAPALFQRILFLLPFGYTMYYPAKLLTKDAELGNNLKGVLILTFSTIFCFVIAKLLWNKGIKKYENVGI